MLEELRVANYALIEDLSLKLGPGLNVLSGETGAGKSIIIGAIGLLLGERALTEQIRQGEENAFVEGIFAPPAACAEGVAALLEEAGIENEGTVIVARELSRSGRSVGRVNGRTVPVFFLRELGELLVDLHGQHEHQSLLRPGYQLGLLDSYGGERIDGALQQVETLFQRRRKLTEHLESLGRDRAERERRMEILSFQIDKIREARLEPDEEAELLKEEKILAHAERLGELLAESYAQLYRGDEHRDVPAVIDLLAALQGRLGEAAQIDSALAPLGGMLESAAAQVEEVALTLRDYQASFEYNPARLDAIQERLEQLRSLKRKYGETIAEVISFGEQAQEELAELKNSESRARELEQEIAAATEQLGESSGLLSERRREAAASLKPLLEERFGELALSRARFNAAVTALEEFTPRGRDRVEFLFSANPGEELKPLAKIISGGEMSRVMLALKTIFAGQERIPTLIFDEIDAGIGGAPIQAVAEKMALLAAHHQIVCVTHSPQIAAMADHHIRLFKELSDERTQTRAESLGKRERRLEIARMLDGSEIGRAGLEHVDSLLGRAQRFKDEGNPGR